MCEERDRFKGPGTATDRMMMDKNKANRSDRATEPDLPPATQVPKEELSPPPRVPQEDLSPPSEVQSVDLSSPTEVSTEDLSSAPEGQHQELDTDPEVPGKEVSQPPQASEVPTAQDRTSDERTEKETILTTEDPAPRERTTTAPPSDTPITISSDEIYPRDSSLEDSQGSEGERWSAISGAMAGGLVVATVIALVALLLLRRRSHSSRR
jgi:hypothetical protein